MSRPGPDAARAGERLAAGDRDVQAVVTELFGSWMATPFGNPRLERSDRHLIIDSRSDGQAGLMVARDLDPDQKYRLVLDGDQVRLRTRLRIKRIIRTVDEPEFGVAPAARVELVVTDIERIELVFFNDGEFSYRLKELRLEPCATCFSDRELRHRIVTEVPAVARLLDAGRTVDAAVELTDWVAHGVDWGWDPRVVEQNSDTVFWQPATSGYAVWTSDRGGAMCGAFAIYHVKVLALFGIDAFSINFGHGDGSGLTHVSTVVPIRDPDGYRFHVVDPTFNASYVDPVSGAPLHLEEVLSRYTSGARDFLFRERAFVRDHFIPETMFPQVERALAKLGRQVPCSLPGLVANGRKCAFQFDMLVFMQLHQDALAAVGFSRGDDLFMDLLSNAVTDIGGQTSVEVLRAFHALLDRYRIPSPASPPAQHV